MSATAGQLVQELIAVAEREGYEMIEARTNHMIAKLVSDGVDVESDAGKLRVTQYVLRQVTFGADDTWSGRGNDARRAFFDGVLKYAEKWTL